MRRNIRPALAAVLKTCPRGQWFWAADVIEKHPERSADYVRRCLSKLCAAGALTSRNVFESDGPRKGNGYRLYHVAVSLDVSPSGRVSFVLPTPQARTFREVVPVEVSESGRVSAILPDTSEPRAGGGVE